ncbi:O-antigen ligase family protein [Brevibacterium senegalense]|uniref:O-antigen ligase family protein n=1 Tax=Brevibacterium senegalense TaxID=1033736 RepID=UPI001FE022BA|nr:O-antigen ligase family protein [Brevibacterium senegalense]
MLYVVAALSLIGPFFGQLLPSVVSPLAIVSAAYLLCLGIALRKDGSKARYSPLALSWLLLAAFAVASQIVASGYDGWIVYAFAFGAGILVFADRTRRWMIPFLSVAAAFSFIHVFATWFFYVFPATYGGLVKARFFASDFSATDYRSGLTSHYSFNAMYCVIAFAIATAVTFGAERRVSRWSGAAGALVALSAVVLTSKRAHMILIIVAFLVVLSVSHLKGRGLRVTLISAVGAFGVYLSTIVSPGISASVDRFRTTFESSDLSEVTSGRTLLWDAAITGWRERPLLGHGWGSFEFVWPGGQQTSFHAHNLVLNSLYEVGILGTLAILLCVFASLFGAFRAVRLAARSAHTSLRVGVYFALTIQVFFAMYALSSGELLSNAYTIAPYMLSLAIVVHVTSARFTETPASPKTSHVATRARSVV